MFMLESTVKTLQENDWNVYGSGGGCYHAMKEFDTTKGTRVAIEIHHNGGAQMYHNGDMVLCDSQSVEEDDNWCNYIILAWIPEEWDENGKCTYGDYDYSDYFNIFPPQTQKEVLESLQNFLACYNNYFL